MHGTLSVTQPASLPRYPCILAFDLGKFNSVLCRFDPATAAHSFISLTTDREAIALQLDPVPVADRPATLVVFETCDISAMGVRSHQRDGFCDCHCQPLH